MKYLLNHLKKHTMQCLLAPLFKMAEAFFDLLVPLIVADIINTGISNGDTKYIISRVLFLLLLAAVGLVCSISAQYFAAKAAVSSASALRKELFCHIQSLSFKEKDNIGISTLITRTTSDINQVQSGVNMFLRLFLRSPFIVFGAVIAAFTVSKRAGIILLISLPVLFVIVFGIMKITSPMYKRNQEKTDNVVSDTRENLQGMRVIRAFCNEEYELDNAKSTNNALAKAQESSGRISSLVNPLTYVVVNIGIIAIIYIGAKQVNAGILRSGNVVALINYMSQILVELIKLANTVVLISKSLASLSRVENVLDTKCDMEYGTQNAKQNPNMALVFKNVSFAYSGSQNAISDVSFDIASGKSLGIIGGTGSGKSTLINLIPRFYDRSCGEILLFGRKIEEYSEDFLRKEISTASQHPELFSGTIKSNLLLGKESATDDEIWSCLETAQAKDFVSEKEGKLESEVAQGGSNLSGGQKQRLSIARALLKKPDILILDDSSSALDYMTDKNLRKAIRNLYGSMTIIIVSQRTASIMNCDKIIVLDNGKIAGCGTHDELLQNCCVYSEIYDSQFRKAGEYNE